MLTLMYLVSLSLFRGTAAKFTKIKGEKSRLLLLGVYS